MMPDRIVCNSPNRSVAPAIREVSAAGASANGPASIVVEIAGAVVRAERGVDLGWLRDVLRAVRVAT
jgi:hypothetical protein